MTITADGDRSRRRLSVAKKALENIVAMDLPVKSGSVEGFTYKVWQQDAGNLTGGRIFSPFGIHVTLSDNVGFKQFVCDSIQCGAAPMYQPLAGDRDIAVLNPLPTSSADPTHVFAGGSAGGMTVPVAPDVAIEAQQWKPAQPVCLPLGGEHVVTNYTYQRSSGHLVVGAQATHCYSNGQGDTASPAINESWSFMPYDNSAEAVNNHYGLIPLLTTQGYFEYMKWKQGGLFLASNGWPKLASYEYFYAPTHAAGSVAITANDAYQGASSTWLAKLQSNAPSGLRVRQIAAHFSRVPGDIKGVSVLWPNSVSGCGVAYQSDPTSACVSPADERWNLALGLLSVAGGNQIVDYNTLGPALKALADGELAFAVSAIYPAGPWGIDAAKTIIGCLFGWPAQSAYTGGPRDTSTFADASGAVYTWMRCTDPNATQDAYAAGYGGVRNGGFRFAYPDGFVRTPLAMPSAVLADTTLRPRVTLMTATTYCCIADKANSEIHGLYVGSPFGNWQDVGLPAGVTMYAIRVLQPGDTAATAGFIGVGKETTPTGTQYRIYIKPAGGAWVALSPIPVSGVNDLISSWDVCVFGDDALTAAMQSARQHPAAMPNIRQALR